MKEKLKANGWGGACGIEWHHIFADSDNSDERELPNDVTLLAAGVMSPSFWMGQLIKLSWMSYLAPEAPSHADAIMAVRNRSRSPRRT